MAHQSDKGAAHAQRMGNAPLGKLMFALGIPAVVAQIINILYNIVDRMYIGHMAQDGPLALTGLGVCAPIILVVSAFAAFVGGGGAPLAAIALGERDEAKAQRILSVSLFLLLALSAVLTVGFLASHRTLLIWFGASPQTLPFASDYLVIYLMGTVFVQLALGLNPFISAQGQARVAMYTVAIGAVANIVLDPILIYGFHMGVAGAAIATVFSQALSAGFVCWWLASSRSQIRLRAPRPSRMAGPIMALGSSTFVMQATEAAIAVVFNTTLLAYGGNVHVGVMTIMQSLLMFLFMPPAAFSMGVQPIISYNFGAGNLERVRETVKKTLVITTSYTLALGVLLMAFAGKVACLFTTDPTLLALTARYLPLFLASMSLFGLQIAAQSLFVATNKPKIALFVASLRKLILIIPLVLLLPRWLGVTGVYLAESISDAISITTATVLMVVVLRRMKSEHQR